MSQAIEPGNSYSLARVHCVLKVLTGLKATILMVGCNSNQSLCLTGDYRAQSAVASKHRPVLW